MRSQKWFLFLGMAAALMLTGLFMGCSDDDNAPTGTVGSLSDPEFIAVQEIIDAVIDSTVTNVGGALSSQNRIPADDSTIINVFLGPNVPGDIVVDASYEYANGWHVLTLTSTGDSFDASYQDSVRFTDASGTPMEVVVQPVAVNLRRHWSYTPGDTTVTNASFVGAASMDLTNIDTNLGMLNGTRTLTVNSKTVTNQSTTWRTFDFSSTLTDIQFDISPIAQLSGCPESGAIVAQIEMTSQKDNEPTVATSWDVTAAFDAGTVNVVVSQGTTTWTYSSEICH
jgi:hypothetical protein